MFIDIEQNTEEWLELRGGKITSSGVSKIMANLSKKNRPFGDPAKQYAVKIALERINGKAISSNFSSSHMDRGHLEEPIARALYEEMNFCEVTNGGFFDNGNTGDSPDGLIYHDGVAEIKSVLGHIQYEVINKGIFQSAYRWQLVWHLRETGRDWVDYISYSGEYPEGNQLFIYKADRDYFANDLEIVEDRLGEFSMLVDECIDQIRGGREIEEIEFKETKKAVGYQPKEQSDGKDRAPATSATKGIDGAGKKPVKVDEMPDPEIRKPEVTKDVEPPISMTIGELISCPEAGGMMVEKSDCDGQSCKPGCPNFKE